MLPSTFAGLILLLALLLPGFIYDLRLDRVVSRPTPSQLREFSRVVAASLACNVAALAGFVILRWFLPRDTPDISTWLRDGNSYWIDHAKLTLPWSGGVFLFACLAGFVSADTRIRKLTRKPLDWLSPGVITLESAWSSLLNMYEDDSSVISIYIGCQLNDGSYVSGPLYSLNEKVEETSDREVILTAPILFRQENQDSVVELTILFTAISARNITRLDVSHLTDKSLYPQPTQGALVTAQGTRTQGRGLVCNLPASRYRSRLYKATLPPGRQSHQPQQYLGGPITRPTR
jgi:hypothetical protein